MRLNEDDFWELECLHCGTIVAFVEDGPGRTTMARKVFAGIAESTGRFKVWGKGYGTWAACSKCEIRERMRERGWRVV